MDELCGKPVIVQFMSVSRVRSHCQQLIVFYHQLSLQCVILSQQGLHIGPFLLDLWSVNSDRNMSTGAGRTLKTVKAKRLGAFHSVERTFVHVCTIFCGCAKQQVFKRKCITQCFVLGSQNCHHCPAHCYSMPLYVQNRFCMPKSSLPGLL